MDAMYEKMRYGRRVISMAIQVVCGENEEGKREVVAIEPMLEESFESDQYLFERLKERGLMLPELVISDTHKGFQKAIRKVSPEVACKDARHISCGTFWCTYRTRKKNLSPGN